jgi:hypothetical protein
MYLSFKPHVNTKEVYVLLELRSLKNKASLKLIRCMATYLIMKSNRGKMGQTKNERLQTCAKN